MVLIAELYYSYLNVYSAELMFLEYIQDCSKCLHY